MREWSRSHVVAVASIVGLVGGLSGCGSNSTDSQSVAPIIKEAPREEAPRFHMELSELAAGRNAEGTVQIRVKYAVTEGQPGNSPYTLVVTFLEDKKPLGGQIPLVEKAGKDLGKDGTLEGQCKLPDGNPTAFVVSVVEGKVNPPSSGGGRRMMMGGGVRTSRFVSNPLSAEMPAAK